MWTSHYAIFGNCGLDLGRFMWKSWLIRCTQVFWGFVGGYIRMELDDGRGFEQLMNLKDCFLIYVKFILDVTTRVSVIRKIRHKTESLSVRCLAFCVM